MRSAPLPMHEASDEDHQASPRQMIEGIFSNFFGFLNFTFELPIDTDSIIAFLLKNEYDNDDPLDIAHCIAYLFFQTFQNAYCGSRHMYAPMWLFKYALECKDACFHIEYLSDNYPSGIEQARIKPRSLAVAKEFLENFQN